MPELGFDVSSYQPDTFSYFKNLKHYGGRFVFVKLTEGTDFTSPLAASQIYSANKNGIKTIGAYHFFHGNGKAEARYFLARVKQYGLDKTTPLALDAEAPDAGYDSNFNDFLDECWKYGYHNLYIYSMASWFGTRIHPSKLNHGHLWVANINGYIGVDNATIWQFNWTYNGLNLDANYCYFPERLGLSSSHVSTEAESQYWSDGHKFKVISDSVQAYRSSTFNESTEKTNLANSGVRPNGYVIYAKPVKAGAIYRLKTRYGTYYTANKKYVKKLK